MAKKSSGVLLFKLSNRILEILLLHPGGPFYTKKDLEVWSIPKGEFEEDEDPKLAAIREFQEETGLLLGGDFLYLEDVKMKSGKIIHCWAKEGEFNVSTFKCNFFDLEWPPKSGKIQSFPEMDKANWFNIPDAKSKIHPSQLPFIDRLLANLNLPDEIVFPISKNKPGQLDLFS